MRSLLFISLCAAGLLHAQPPRAMLVMKTGEGGLVAKEVHLLAVTEKRVAYKENLLGEIEVRSRKEIDSIAAYEPKDYLEALDLYEGRHYEEARFAFAKVKDRYRGCYPGIKNNFAVMAGYHELEALRKLGDLEGLRMALRDYSADGLTHKVPRQQLEIYELWDAIRANCFTEALHLAERFKDKRLPGFQRAQVAYCEGRALEGLNADPDEILFKYQIAMTADAGESEIIARDACLRSLMILHQDEEVQRAMKAFDQGEAIRGFSKVMEAAGLASMYQISLGNGFVLPSQYVRYLNYTPERVRGVLALDGE